MKHELNIMDEYISFSQNMDKDQPAYKGKIRLFRSSPDEIQVVITNHTELGTPLTKGLKERDLMADFTLTVAEAKKIYEFVKKELA